MIQSTFFDLVLGLDTHVVGIPAPPAPAPVPTPIPMPFVGMVFDPLGLAIGAAVGLLTGGGPNLVLVNSMPVTNCGTTVTNMLTMPHVPVPGVTFIPPPAPANDAMLYFGSNNVSMGGTLGVRLGDVALSCSDPVRLPTSVVLAIPKGPLVLNMPAMVPDFSVIAMSAAMHGLGALARRGAALFRRFRAGSAFFQRLSRRLGGCHAPNGAGRWRQMWARTVRFVTGHPVDVVTGNVFTSVVDLSLPGPLPLVLERVYESAGSGRRGTLGHGWSHSLDESLWMERGRAVVRCGDGREIEFPLWDLPERQLRPGDAVTRVIHKLELRCTAPDRFELENEAGDVREFAPLPGAPGGPGRLVRVRSRDGHHVVQLEYDERGSLSLVRDAGGRLVRFEHDERGRLVALQVPDADGRPRVHRRYTYDGHDDLVEVVDALGNSWRYVYDSHLLVQETDRTGLSFHFQYDGRGASAKCVRTWGDGGIYDHLLSYDQVARKTVVEDSLGATTVYSYNERNQVVAITNAHGATRRFEYDPDTGGRTAEEDALGARTERRFDPAGRLLEEKAADGGTTRFEYQGGALAQVTDARGGRWRYRHDRAGHVVERTSPSGDRTTFSWEAGLLTSARWNGGAVAFSHDDQKNVSSVELPGGGLERRTSDSLGRIAGIVDARGGVTRADYDAEGRLRTLEDPTGWARRLSYDAEGNLTEVEDAVRRLRIRHASRRIVEREEAGARTRFEWDTEGRLRAVTNEAGERFTIVLDALGRAREEIGFDGERRVFEHDAADRVIRVRAASGRQSASAYDPVGRLRAVEHADGTFARFTYDAAGLIVAAENESGRVELEYDADGLVVVERRDGREVRSRYADGARVEVATSLGARALVRRGADGGARELRLGSATAERATITFEVGPDGLERQRRHSNGVVVEWSRDVAGRPTGRRVWTGSGAAPAEPASSRESAATAYQWRGEEQLAAMVDARQGPRFFDHDARGRLVRERLPGEVLERSFDDVGNLYRRADRSDRQYSAGGRLERAEGDVYRHDADGNQTTKTTESGGSWSYVWNGHGALREIVRPDGSRVQFEYDAFVRRTSKRTLAADGTPLRQTCFVWDGHAVIHELDTDEGLVTWHWDPDALAPLAKERDRQIWMIAPDHLGAPAEMYDESGGVAWQAQIDVLGRARVSVGAPSDCPWRWPGQYEDAEHGAAYQRCRYYDPERGSFISKDPAGLLAGLNLYAYPSDPLLWIDLLGLTGTYIFQFASGEMYIGKGPIERARASQSVRAAQLGTSTSSIAHGAHADFGSSRMGLMVEAELMARHNFGTNPSLLNAINSPGRNLLAGATAAERAMVTAEANALEQALKASHGRIC